MCALIILSFEDLELRDTCVNLELAEQRLGTFIAQSLVNFISEAYACENVEELINFLGDNVRILPDDSLSVVIGSDCFAALVVAGKRYDRGTNERVLWASVKRLKLVKISRSS